MNNNEQKKGFTLIELLVVIAILATLAVAVTLILNPAELVRQGRDSTRLSDLSTLQSAVSLYLADSGNPTIPDVKNCTATESSPPAGAETCTVTASTTVGDGNDSNLGWVEVDFGAISSGAPLSNLPLDPVNDNEYYYVFLGDNSNTTFELNANMESVRYSNEGDDDVESTDGGNDDTWYEIGNDPELDLDP